ncbi:MAG: ABC transporter substrate-binding protein [Chloroflexota bacterium]
MRCVPLFFAAALLTGCAGVANPPAHSATLVGGTLRWGVTGVSDLPTLDPALASDPASLSAASMVYGGLVRLDGRLHVVPDGARRWTIDRSGMVYTFYLRRNVRFADGKRVNAPDFSAALRRALSAGDAAGTGPIYLSLIARSPVHVLGYTRPLPGLSVLSALVLRIVLVRPAAHFLAELAFPASFVPEDGLTSRYGSVWTDHAAGFGPYVVHSWLHGRSLILVRNPFYYGKKPLLKRVVITFYEQPRSAVDAYRAGREDMVSGLAPGAGPPANVEGAQRVRALALDYLAFNTKRLPFLRLFARRAFAAVWSPRIARVTVGSAAFASTGVLPSAFGLTTPTRADNGSASAFLARGRYPGGKGFPSITLVLPRDPHVHQVARRLATAWQDVLGVTVNIRQLNPSTFDSVLNARDFDVAIVRWGGDYPDPQDFLATQLGEGSGNVTGWKGHAYGRDLSLADSYAPTDPRRLALYRQAVALIERKVPVVALDEPAVVALISPRLAGVQVTPLNTISGAWSAAGFKG